MQKLKLIPVLLLTFCLCGCHSAPDSVADPVTDAQPDSGTVTESDYTNININNHISINNTNHVKLLCAWQDTYYIQQGYIAPHYMIYYVTDENQAYSAFWETDELTPDNAILHMDDFTNTEALGEISFDPDHLLAEVRTQELTFKTESEQLDIDEPNIWFYGYQSNPDNPDETDQFLFYQTGDNIPDKRVQTDEGIELVNQLYSESTFEDARFQWSSFYSSL
ncbi:MAG: hypothetical protein K2O42_02095 [Oscillospiraceae bacterium]|nr:hypothetical protein [Oscillospiraceae bacterium]